MSDRKVKVTFELRGWTSDDGPTTFDLIRLETPIIVDKAGRRQWLREYAAERQTILQEGMTLGEAGALMAELADTLQYHLGEGK